MSQAQPEYSQGTKPDKHGMGSQHCQPEIAMIYKLALSWHKVEAESLQSAQILHRRQSTPYPTTTMPVQYDSPASSAHTPHVIVLDRRLRYVDAATSSSLFARIIARNSG